MPLIHSASDSAVHENIRRERAAGKPENQAVAIAMDIQRRNKAIGGSIDLPSSHASSRLHVGPIKAKVAGRTDHVPINVPAGAYVIPADVVSEQGQNNTDAGFDRLEKVFADKTDYTGYPHVPIMAAGGEYVVGPNAVKRRGNGNLNHGHDILDAWVKSERRKLIGKLKNLPGPKKG